jgi:hypothetical protein
MMPRSSIQSDARLAIMDRLVTKLVLMYRHELQIERATLHVEEFEAGDGGFSILGHMEVCADRVAGVVCSLVRHRFRRDPADAVRTLRAADPFRSDPFREWFLACQDRYPAACLYIELTDYLRRLAIEYLERRTPPAVARDREQSV